MPKAKAPKKRKAIKKSAAKRTKRPSKAEEVPKAKKPSEKLDIDPGDAEAVAKTVQSWLGNPLSRAMIKFVSGKGTNGNRLENGLKKYAGFHVELENWRDKLAYRVIKSSINKGVKAFDAPRDQMMEALQDPIFRRGIVNVLEGIAEFGVQRPQTTAAPFLVVWNFTHCCNLKCKHCYENSDATFLPDELTTEEAKVVLDQFKEAGVVAVAFSGGEPLMRKDFFEVAKYAKENGFYVSIATNATLVTPAVAKKLKEVVDYVEISLDGFEKTHDDFRGIPGIWKRTVAGIRNCVAEGLDTCTATTVTKLNLKELPELIEFAEKDLKVSRMIFFNYIPTRRGKKIAKQDLSPDEREKLLDFLYSRMLDKNCKLDVFSTSPQYAVTSAKYACGPAVATHFTNKDATEALQGKTKNLTEFIGGCGCARLYAALEPNGDIFPCVFMPIKIGNIRKDKIKEVWKSNKELKKMRDRSSFKGCGNCKYKTICGGCRARAYGYFGDVQGPDPGCKFNMRYWKQLQE
jgi:radical SAM protein with 4Fe4S-binding SPASM domain